MRTAIYIRVSTTHQVEDGFSLDTQKDRLTSLAKANGYEVYKIYEELGKSGKNTNRPAFQEMMKDMRDGCFSKILVMKLDRISRSVADLEDIIKEMQKYNCEFESASEKIDTNSSMGMMFVRLLGVFAQFERERIAERIKDVVEEKVKTGGAITGSIPLGYKIEQNSNGDKIVVKDLDKENFVNDMFKIYEKTYSLRKTSLELSNKYDFFPPTSNNLSGTRLKRLLSNELYAGINRDNKQYCEAYITEERFNKIQDIIKRYNVKRYKHEFLFSGLLKSTCGHKLIGHFAHGKNTYRCKEYSTTRKCSANSVVEEYVEKEFIKQVKPAIEKQIKKLELEANNKKNVDNSTLINKLEKKKESIVKSFINGWITEEDAKNQIADIAKELNSYKNEKITNINGLKKMLNTQFDKLYWGLDKTEKMAFIRFLGIDYILIDYNKYASAWRNRKEDFLTIYFL